MPSSFIKSNENKILERFFAYWQNGVESSFSRDELIFLESYFTEHDPTEKLPRVYDLGIALYPSDFYFLWGKAHWLIRFESSTSAASLIAFLRREFPDYFETQFLDFFLLAIQGENNKALQVLTRSLRDFAPLHPSQSFMVYESLEQLGLSNPHLTRKLYKHSLKTPEINRYYFLRILDQGLSPALAKRIFNRLVKYFPDDTELFLAYAEFLKSNNRQAEATAILEKLLDRNPHHPTAHLLLGELMETRGMYPAAIYHYLRVLHIQSPSAGIFMRLGVCYEKTGNDQRAQEFYRLAVYEDPAYLPAWFAMVQLALQHGDYDKALLVNIEAVEKIPNAKLLESLGYLYLKKERIPAALHAYKEAYRLGGRSKELLLILHDLYRQSNLIHEANEILEQVRQRYGNDPEVINRINPAQ